MTRVVRSVINGHLAWTAQNASGNRGDDFRALKLCELQPYTFLHPNGETGIQSILGLQGEEKAGAGRGMKTVCCLNITDFWREMLIYHSESQSSVFSVYYALEP